MHGTAFPVAGGTWSLHHPWRHEGSAFLASALHGTGPACRLIFWLVKKAGNIEPGGVRQLCSVVGIALGRKAWLFAGSDRGGPRAADMYSRIVTAKLNDVDP